MRIAEKAFKIAKDRGATTLLNPSPVRPIPLDIRTLTDLLVVNEHELAALSDVSIRVDNDATIFKACERLSHDGYQAVIVTLGDKGVRLIHRGQNHRLAARSVPAVDTTGAGDTFIGGLTAGLLSGLDLVQAAEMGNLAASLSVMKQGAASSIPTLDEVKQIFSA